ncbi:MAG: acyclic terpene utilization AtuA family protein [Burkholderiaceae bacterium]
MKTIALREIAHCRSGEKGHGANVSVIAYDEADYALLERTVTVEAVRELYGAITKGAITRFEAPRIGALNFVLDNVLEGGRSRTLAFEESGKALSSLMLRLPVTVPDDFLGIRERRARRAHEAGPRASATGPQTSAATDSGRADEAATTDKRVRIGAATGWSRDRFEPALELILHGDIDYLGFDSMSEVTMSAAQVARMSKPDQPGYDPLLEARLTPLLVPAKERGVRIITNQGWLDPQAAARRIVALAREQGLSGLKVAAVSGGILTDRIAGMGLDFVESGAAVASRRDAIVSAETYLGAAGIVQALAAGADIVITTRVADGCVYLGPLAHEFGWRFDDWHALARGMIIGHLMECGCQVSGGYFADPGYKDVPDLHRVGNPICTVTPTRNFIGKLPDSGGLVSPATCKEQLLYEVQDPANYLLPDVVADLTRVSFRQHAENEVEVLIAAAGKPRTDTMKALVGLREGFTTEEMVLFAGPGAMARAQLTRDVLERRFAAVNLKARELRMDLVGLNAVHREASPAPTHEPYEVILRIALKTDDALEADKLRREVDPLAVNGAAGTGKWATTAPGSRVAPVVGLDAVLVPREAIAHEVTIYE